MSSAYRFVRGRNGRFLLILLALILFVILLTVRAARASTFVVNSTADAVDANPGDGVCAAAGEACTLRAAIQEANALSGPAVINLPAGTYALTIAGAGEDASASGDLDVSGELTIVGAGSGVTTIDASAIADRIFQLNSSSLALEGVTLTGGNVTGDGGAFWLVEAALDLTDVVISGNAASGQGGAIYAGSSEVTLIDSQVSGNSAAFTSGIRLVDAFANLTLQDTDVADDIQLQDGTLLLSGAVGGALDGVISGSAVIEKVGGGVYTLSQINNYSGDTRITAGTLRITHPLALGSSSEGTTVAAGATLDYDDQVVGVLYYTLEPLILNGGGVNGEGALRFSTGAAYSGPVILNSDSAIGVYSGAFTAVIDANISGPGSLTKVGPDLLLFRSVDKSYSGATTVQAGTLWIDASSDLPNATALTVNASAFLWLDNADVTAGSLAGGGTVYGSGALTVGGDNSSALFSGPVGAFGSSFDLVKLGSGTLTLTNGGNAWNGATIVNGGALDLGATGVLPAGTAVTVNAPGTLLLNDLPQTVGALGGDGAIVIGPGGGLTAGDAGDHTFAGTISGNRLTKDGAGTLTLTNPGHTHADTAVAAGTLRLGVANALAATTGDVTIAGGAALDAQGFDQTLRNLSGAGDLLNAGILSLENSVDTAFSGDLTGLGFTDLTKSGPARLTLNGAVTADAVNLAAGDLAINGALTIPEGMLSAAPETTLRGAGTINAFTSVAGTLAPGASPGVLTLFELFLDAGAVYEVEIAGLTPGEGYDQVVVTASVELAGGAGLNMIGLDYTPLAGDEFVLIDNQGFGPVVGTFAGLPEGAQVSSDFLGSGQAATISYAGGDGNDVVVTVVGDIPQSSPFTVNTLDDVDDGRCGVNHCSLREAINAANAAPNSEGPDLIAFDIAGGGVKTIQPAAPLPSITDAVDIDGGSDPDGVVLDGALAGDGAHGLTIDGDGASIQNLTITGFDGAGIAVVGGQGNTFRANPSSPTAAWASTWARTA
jgi:fibronectin-binding autotransporter adhesin